MFSNEGYSIIIFTGEYVAISNGVIMLHWVNTLRSDQNCLQIYRLQISFFLAYSFFKIRFWTTVVTTAI